MITASIEQPPVPSRLRPSIDKKRSQDFGRWLGCSEWIVVILLALSAAALHIRFVTHVGALWRDESNSISLATLPTFSEIWHLLEFDSFPILFPTLLRGWAGIFGVANDAALRALGLIIGLGILVALWRNARTLGARLPVLSFALVAFNPMLIRYGDSARAYGLGILLILLTFHSFWRLVSVDSPGFRRVLPAAVLALLSVQCLYYNSVLLLAICAGAAAVALRTRTWRTASIVIAIGALAASSLLPYLPMIRRMHEWTFLVSHPVDLTWLWQRVCEVTGSPDPIGIWIWAGLFIIAVLVIASFGFYSRLPTPVLFAGVALLVAVPAYGGFLWILSYHTRPWYYIALAAFAACALDIVFGAWFAHAKFLQLTLVLRVVRLVVALVLLCVMGLPAWAEMPIRHTNVDLVAAQLQSRTTKADVILLSHWDYAVSLSRYYRGPAAIVTVPPIDDHRFHRYDLVLRQMMTADALQPVFVQLERVLRSGHRVFLAGRFSSPQTDSALPSVPPGYRDSSGRWHGANFQPIWRLQAGHFVRSHATRLIQIQVPVPAGTLVQSFENLDFGMAEGWR
jgi:uncharacterized membrane protein